MFASSELVNGWNDYLGCFAGVCVAVAIQSGVQQLIEHRDKIDGHESLWRLFFKRDAWLYFGLMGIAILTLGEYWRVTRDFEVSRTPLSRFLNYFADPVVLVFLLISLIGFERRGLRWLLSPQSPRDNEDAQIAFAKGLCAPVTFLLLFWLFGALRYVLSWKGGPLLGQVGFVQVVAHMAGVVLCGFWLINYCWLKPNLRVARVCTLLALGFALAYIVVAGFWDNPDR